MRTSTLLQRPWSSGLLDLLCGPLLVCPLRVSFIFPAQGRDRGELETSGHLRAGGLVRFRVTLDSVMLLSRRLRFDAGSWMRSFLGHALGSVLFSLAYMVIRALVGQWQSGATFEEAFKPLLVKTWHFTC
jgi:hypothetical protein